jgi:sigma-B regulation protein RsbU (phosphoserine phosphatase)
MHADHISRVVFAYASRIGAARDTHDFLQLNADMARDLVGADRCSVWLVDRKRDQIWTTVAHGVNEIRIPLGTGIVGATVATGETILVNDTENDPRFMKDAAGGYQTRSIVSIPLRGSDGTVIGVLQALNKPDGFEAEDAELLGLAAAYAANSLEAQRNREAAEGARLLQKEIDIASNVQRRLFPQNPPKIAGLDYAALCRPAKGVGGDYYDFIPMPDGGLMVTLGDVSGKGIAAAVLMASIQASIRAQTVEPPDSLAKLIESFNKAIYSFSTSDKYSTLFVARLDATARKFQYVNAGQAPPTLLRANGTAESLTAGGMPVGLVPFSKYEQGEVDLETGDAIIICSDGVSEAMNPDQDMLADGTEEELLRQYAGLPAAEVARKVVEAVDRFANGAEQSDDITITVLRMV